MVRARAEEGEGGVQQVSFVLRPGVHPWLGPGQARSAVCDAKAVACPTQWEVGRGGRAVNWAVCLRLLIRRPARGGRADLTETCEVGDHWRAVWLAYLCLRLPKRLRMLYYHCIRRIEALWVCICLGCCTISTAKVLDPVVPADDMGW